MLPPLGSCPSHDSLDGHHTPQEVYELHAVRSVAKEEVDPPRQVSDLDTLLVRPVLEDELLQEEEGALVGHMLADLQGDQGSGLLGCRGVGFRMLGYEQLQEEEGALVGHMLADLQGGRGSGPGVRARGRGGRPAGELGIRVMCLGVRGQG